MRKSKIIGWIIASPFILIAGGIAFCEANKAYWDHKVKQWCEEDGGVTVNKVIAVDSLQFNNLGTLAGYKVIGQKSNKRMDAPAYSILSQDLVKKSWPKITKNIEKVFNSVNDEYTGVIVSYSRIGGDFPTIIAFPSSFNCPDKLERYKNQVNFFKIIN